MLQRARPVNVGAAFPSDCNPLGGVVVYRTA
jgi:hypothetical protein